MSFMETCRFVGTDPRTKKWILPAKILQVSGNVLEADTLLTEKSMQIGLREPQLTALKNEPGAPHAAILLDFGYEFHGGVRLLSGTTRSGAAVRVRLTFGESAAEALSTPGERGACNDHSPRDFEVAVPVYSDLEFGQTGYRFLKIELLGDTAEWKIKSVMGCAVFRDLKYVGSFSCNDDLLNRIYDTAAYTCHLNMQTMLWDGIKRDRLVWIGDTHPEMLAIRTLFGDDSLVVENLRFSRDETPLPGWMNWIPSYSFWWIIILYESGFSSGDFSFAMESRSYTEDLLRFIFLHIREDGTHSFGDYFLDWRTKGHPEAVAGVHAILYRALLCGRELCRIFRNEALERECTQVLSCLKQKIPDPRQSSAANALLAANGLIPDEQAMRVILENGANGLTVQMSYYILTALAEKGYPARALDYLRTYYGGMLAMGATSFWEDFDLSWMENAQPIDALPEPGKRLIHGDTGQYCYQGFRHSLCHGWSAGPVAFLAEQVLGIQVTGTGGTRIHLSPKLCDLKFAKGIYPTMNGAIEVTYEKRGDRTVLTHLKKPTACEVSADADVELSYS